MKAPISMAEQNRSYWLARRKIPLAQNPRIRAHGRTAFETLQHAGEHRRRERPGRFSPRAMSN
jgi:hypothetical protein